jgi:WD40 repeat protein
MFIVCRFNCILQVLCGHTNYVNCIAYESDGQFLASVSDDHKCKLWNIKEDNSCTATFFLTSPGIGNTVNVSHDTDFKGYEFVSCLPPVIRIL